MTLNCASITFKRVGPISRYDEARGLLIPNRLELIMLDCVERVIKIQGRLSS